MSQEIDNKKNIIEGIKNIININKNKIDNICVLLDTDSTNNENNNISYVFVSCKKKNRSSLHIFVI